MAYTVSADGSFLVINDGTYNRLTIPFTRVRMFVDGDEVVIAHEAKYATRLTYSDVSSPNAASAELLRTAISDLMV